MSKQINNKGVIYTIRRTYKSTYSVDELISSIIQTHYYNNDSNEIATTSQKSQQDHVSNLGFDLIAESRLTVKYNR